MKTILKIITIICLLLSVYACDDSRKSTFNSMDILPESVKNKKFPQESRKTTSDNTENSKPKSFNEILDKIGNNENQSYNPYSISEIEEQIDRLNTAYTSPIILRNNDVRLRSYPYLNSDVKAVLKSGRQILLKKRTREKKIDIYGNKYYWFYVEIQNSLHNQKEDSGWVYGGDIFKQGFNYPYMNNINVIDTDENTEQILIKNAIFKDFKIQHDKVKLHYRPDPYSQTVIRLNKNDIVNLCEKTIFKQSFDDYNKGRWYYAIYKNEGWENNIISGWIYEKYLPDSVSDELKSKLPYNQAYKAFEQEPAYIAILDKEKSAVKLVCRINTATGIISDIPLTTSYNNDIQYRSKWIRQNFKDNEFFIYSYEGKEVGRALPKLNIDINDKKTYSGNESILIDVNMTGIKDLPNDTNTFTALSMKGRDNKSPFYVIEHNKVDYKPFKHKIDKFITNGLKEKMNTYDVEMINTKYKQYKWLDIKTIKHENKEKYIFTADYRMMSTDEQNESDSYVLRMIGLLTNVNDDTPTLLADTFKKSKSREALDYISTYKGISGIIDLNRNGNDEIIIETENLTAQSHQILLLGSEKAYVIYE